MASRRRPVSVDGVHGRLLRSWAVRSRPQTSGWRAGGGVVAAPSGGGGLGPRPRGSGRAGRPRVPSPGSRRPPPPTQPSRRG
ncbi:MAG: hypothetical protein AVDCRST_MAG20-2631 [uncultured Acidimicrobiales bacterium]|uniref:Uncharacterized protein n=1 Tax=uncultured Acidimicrobiales bacterium TaxID=310071 RepID=A0A6J4ISI3_9ACTN|nr:MAG: hypothetical protein AVDCRST_MAG20-2631 [uncultured Acidimicrobiales bacterium]